MVKNPAANTGDARKVDSIPRLRRSPGAGNGNLLQYSCLENSLDRQTWWVHGAAESQTRLNDRAHTHTHTHTHNNFT